MDNGSSIEPLTVPAVSNPPPLPPRRNLSPMPPPLPPRRLPGDLTVTDASLVLSKIEDAEEKGLDEKQLRELYDNEEIDRFLTLFSDYVTEVQVADTSGMEKSKGTHVSPPDSENIPEEDEEWTPISSTGETSSLPSVTPAVNPTPHSTSLAAEIAYRYVVPVLPRTQRSPPPFTIGRSRLAAQRIYLATLPVYGPFFSQVASLATWEDSSASLMYCSIYWVLWWYNFLIPGLVLRIIFALLKQGIFCYPSLEDLRRHREEVMRANEFGEQVSTRLFATSTGVTEAIHLYKLFMERRKKEKTKDSGDVLVDREEEDVKRTVIFALNEIADLHERVKNIFLWRRPASSRLYGVALFILFLLTMLPAQVLSKLLFFILGFLFWHVVPVMSNLTPSDRARFPPAFNDVPTDVDYAMQLISQRVAAGLEIKPIKRDRLHQRSTVAESLPEQGLKVARDLPQGSENPIDWKKWGNRVAQGKSAVSDLSGFKFGNLWSASGIAGIAQPQSTVETHTYPCQHRSAPGLITLTQDTMFFTPLLRQDANVIIPLTAVKGVKKVGMLKGLRVQWNDTSVDKENKFLWIGERDDLFARLVGLDGRRWIQI